MWNANVNSWAAISCNGCGLQEIFYRSCTVLFRISGWVGGWVGQGPEIWNCSRFLKITVIPTAPKQHKGTPLAARNDCTRESQGEELRIFHERDVLFPVPFLMRSLYCTLEIYWQALKAKIGHHSTQDLSLYTNQQYPNVTTALGITCTYLGVTSSCDVEPLVDIVDWKHTPGLL